METLIVIIVAVLAIFIYRKFAEPSEEDLTKQIENRKNYVAEQERKARMN